MAVDGHIDFKLGAVGKIKRKQKYGELSAYKMEKINGKRLQIAENFALGKEIGVGESNDIQHIKCKKKSTENVAKSQKLLPKVPT